MERDRIPRHARRRAPGSVCGCRPPISVALFRRPGRSGRRGARAAKRQFDNEVASARAQGQHLLADKAIRRAAERGH